MKIPYDVFQGDEIIFTGSPEEIGARYGISKNTVRSYAYNHIPIDQNLRVETGISKRQQEEWDQVRLMILWDHQRTEAMEQIGAEQLSRIRLVLEGKG